MCLWGFDNVCLFKQIYKQKQNITKQSLCALKKTFQSNWIYCILVTFFVCFASGGKLWKTVKKTRIWVKWLIDNVNKTLNFVKLPFNCLMKIPSEQKVYFPTVKDDLCLIKLFSLPSPIIGWLFYIHIQQYSNFLYIQHTMFLHLSYLLYFLCFLIVGIEVGEKDKTIIYQKI